MLNRRKIILTMLCAAAGVKAYAQRDGTFITTTSKQSFSFELDTIESFIFKFEGKTITLDSKEIWQELNTKEN